MRRLKLQAENALVAPVQLNNHRRGDIHMGRSSFKTTLKQPGYILMKTDSNMCLESTFRQAVVFDTRLNQNEHRPYTTETKK